MDHLWQSSGFPGECWRSFVCQIMLTKPDVWRHFINIQTQLGDASAVCSLFWCSVEWWAFGIIHMITRFWLVRSLLTRTLDFGCLSTEPKNQTAWAACSFVYKCPVFWKNMEKLSLITGRTFKVSCLNTRQTSKVWNNDQADGRFWAHQVFPLGDELSDIVVLQAFHREPLRAAGSRDYEEFWGQ